MERRSFIRQTGLAGVLAAGAAPAVVHAQANVRWRLASSFPKSLDTIFGGAETFAKKVGELSGGKFQISTHAGGELMPPFGVVDGVQAGTVEMGHTASYYYVGKDLTFALDCAVPFGLNARQQDAWWNWGGGRQAMNEFFKDYNIHSIPCGNTGAQMGGWFRKEIKSVDDLKGLKFRVSGFAGEVLTKLGVVPQQIAGGDIYPALEKGTIDAAEWVGPYDDQKLGFNKVAPNYYYPGWWEAGPQLSAYVNLAKWAELPKSYQAIIEAAAAKAHTSMLSKYDAQNPKAVRELVASGTKLLPFSPQVLEACYNATNEVFASLNEKNPKWRKIFETWKPFRAEEVLWFRVAENTMDNFMARQSAANKL